MQGPGSPKPQPPAAAPATGPMATARLFAEAWLEAVFNGDSKWCSQPQASARPAVGATPAFVHRPYYSLWAASQCTHTEADDMGTRALALQVAQLFHDTAKLITTDKQKWTGRIMVTKRLNVGKGLRLSVCASHPAS